MTDLEAILSQLIVAKSQLDRDYALGNVAEEDYDLHQQGFIKIAAQEIEELYGGEEQDNE